MQRSTDKLRTGHAALAALAVPDPHHQPRPSTIITKASYGNPLNILQLNANGISNKQVELGEFLVQHKVKVAVIHKSKLSLNFRTPNIENFTNAKEVVYSH